MMYGSQTLFLTFRLIDLHGDFFCLAGIIGRQSMRQRRGHGSRLNGGRSTERV